VKSQPGAILKSLNGPVLITGHTGFKGTWLTLLLEQLGVDVVGYSLAPEINSLYSRLERAGKIPEKYANILDMSELGNFIAEKKPAAIFHLAAQPLVLNSYDNPVETFEINVIGTANVLKIAFECNFVNAIAAITTDKVYKNENLGRRFIETDPLEGKDPYSASKVGSEAVISAFQNISILTNGPKVISLRAGNVIGGGDFAKDRLIPDLIRAVIDQKPVHIRNPDSTRPWQHVLDPLIGYILATEASISGNPFTAFNFGPSEASLSVREVVRIFTNDIGCNINVIEIDRTDSLESLTLELSSELAQKELSWEPRMSQFEAIISTFEWWKIILNNHESPLRQTVRQINEYLQ